MSTPEHHHQVVDAEAHYPLLSNNRIVMPGPIRCLGCDADQAALIADMRDSGHDVTEDDGQVILEVAR